MTAVRQLCGGVPEITGSVGGERRSVTRLELRESPAFASGCSGLMRDLVFKKISYYYFLSFILDTLQMP